MVDRVCGFVFGGHLFVGNATFRRKFMRDGSVIEI